MATLLTLKECKRLFSDLVDENKMLHSKISQLKEKETTNIREGYGVCPRCDEKVTGQTNYCVGCGTKFNWA